VFQNGRNLIRSDIKSNMYTEHLFFPLSYRATATLVILLQRYWDMENHLVTETHYSPSVKLLSLSFRRVKLHDRDNIASKYLFILRRSISPSLSLSHRKEIQRQYEGDRAPSRRIPIGLLMPLRLQ